MTIGKYYPLPWHFAYTPQDGAAVYDASGRMVCLFFWPGHAIEETAEVERCVEEFAKEVALLPSLPRNLSTISETCSCEIPANEQQLVYDDGDGTRCRKCSRKVISELLSGGE